MATTLINGLGGAPGFGENALVRSDDGSSTFIDLTPVLPGGLNFFGQLFTGLWVNNNGSVSFASQHELLHADRHHRQHGEPADHALLGRCGHARRARPRPRPAAPPPAATRSGTTSMPPTASSPSPGTMSATSTARPTRLNAFQLPLTKVGDDGDFNITLRYENIDWTTGDFSGGSGGLGGTVARAGYSSGNGLDYLELPQSGDQAAILALESASNIGTPGTYRIRHPQRRRAAHPRRRRRAGAGGRRHLAALRLGAGHAVRPVG